MSLTPLHPRPLMGKKHFHVAICSRDNEVNFTWLRDLMERDCKSKVRDVTPVHVTNDSSHFQQEMSRYTFAVLYHTRKRGRINITDVTDSLYDDELKFLYEELGKDNVIVVIDDLESSAEVDRTRILSIQTSIGRYSGALLLFTEDDKKISSPELQKRLETISRVLKKAKYLKRKTKETESKKKHQK